MRFSRNMCAPVATGLVTFLSSLPGWAEEAVTKAKEVVTKAHEAVAEVAHAAGAETAHKAEGLPQLDPTLFPEQIFWLVVTFILLYILMSSVALPRVAKTQEHRQKVIHTEIETARAANEKAKESVDATEKALQAAREKAQNEVNELLAQVTNESSERRISQEKELLRKVRRAEETIVRSRTAAMERVQSMSTELAEEIVNKVLEDSRKRA